MMKRMVQRSLPFLVLAGLMSCKGDPTGDLRNGFDHALASPGTLFVTEGTTGFVIVTAVDEQGNSVVGRFSDPAAVGTGITVVLDDTYLPVYDSKGNLVPQKERTSVRYAVHADANTANSSFQLTVSGQTITVPVRIIPAIVNVVTASALAPVPGDTITLTAPAPYKFTPTSVATAGSATLFKVSLSADSTVLRVVPVAGISVPISISNTILTYAPDAATLTVLTSAPVVTVANRLALNKTTFAIGDTVIATAPLGYRFIGGGADTISIGGAPFFKIGISTDSTKMRLLIGPNANDQVKVTGLRVRGLTTGFGPFTLSSDSVLSPVVTNFPATFSAAAPAIQDTITVTAGAGFKFLPTAQFATSGLNAFVVSRAADSSSVRVVPIPGTTSGPVTVSGVVASTLTNVSLTLPTTASLTIPAAYAAGAIATAPTINIPATGATSTYIDNGSAAAASACDNIGFHCRFYKIVLAAPRTFRVTLNWGNTADIGGYFINAVGDDQFGDFACDAKGAGAAGQPETCSQTLGAGTWYLALADFTSASPQNTSWRITLLGQ